MKATNKSKRRRKSSHPVPEWMNADLAAQVEQLDITERLTLADRMEAKAKQLRGMNPSPPKRDVLIRFEVSETLADACRLFCDLHGGKEDVEERDKPSLGARWILEAAISRLPFISKACDAEAGYREAEGFDAYVLKDALASRSMAELRKNYEEMSD